MPTPNTAAHTAALQPAESMRRLAADYAACRDRLAALVQAVREQVSTIERGATPEILKAARKIAALHNDLQAAITAHPECFVRPRTMVVDGLKFGLQKQKGRISWEDDRALCERIMKLTESGAIEPQQAETLIEYRPRPVAAALEQLDAKTLKRLGVTVTLDSDAPLIKTVDSDIEKIVTQMVKQATRNLDGGQA
ncbi:MAG: hypothetical protein ACFNZS_00940 [Ottowia sp.]|nr:hypothetical protein [uncultured Ottowia sp.]